MNEKITNYQKVRDDLLDSFEKIDSFIEDIIAERTTLEERFKEFKKIAEFRNYKINDESIKKLMNKPYTIVDVYKPNIWKVVVWNGVDFSIGWLESQDEAFDIYLVNKYASFLGEIPEILKERFQFKEELPLKVFDGILLTGEKHQQEAWDRYKHHLSKREGSDRIRIIRGHEFNLICEMIADGILPFRPLPLDSKDLIDIDVSFTLREYQLRIWEKFLTLGAMGIFWASQSGKTFVGLYALAHISGKKLVIVGTTATLVEQWIERILRFIPNYRKCSYDPRKLIYYDNNNRPTKEEIIVQTYQSYHKIKDQEFTFTIFDECHHLPATTYSRLSTIKTKYRMGLSATPYREDGRTNLIFGLTGYPEGLSWDILFQLGVIKKPDIICYRVTNDKDKVNKLQELLEEKNKTLVFCDSKDFGYYLEKTFGYPYVSGDTKPEDRLGIINQSIITFVSRVGDEGIAIDNIERTIEVGYHGKSKRQAIQRAGRGQASEIALKSNKTVKHIIIMTDEEFDNDWLERSKPYREKKFNIAIIRA